MRVSIGLGLIALVGFVACGTDADGPAAVADAPGSRMPGGGDHGTSTDPTEPGPPAEPGTPGAPPEDPSDPETPPAPVVSGLAITDVAVFQAVKVPVVADGQPVSPSGRKAPVVAKRTGMIRVYVQPQNGWTPKDVTAELRLVAQDQKFPIIRDTKRISGVSKDEDASSTFSLEVPGESLPPGVTFQVTLTAPDGEKAEMVKSSEGRYPRDGSFESLGAEVGGKLRVVLVPVKYDADGSGRTPRLGTAELDLYRKRLMRLYPASDVELTARAPMPWDGQLSSNGNGFPNVLRAVTQLRAQDGAEKDVYYYGLLAPKASMAAYCGGGCVTGVSAIVDNPNDAAMRASIGIGFGNEESANTLAHEIGHAHGRKHSPCGGAQGVDPRYPHQGGAIGAWGYDIFDKTLIEPSKGRDIMGYCRNEWVSDYTYNAFFERIAAISLEKDVASPAPARTTPRQAAHYRVATLGATNEMTWEGDLDLDEALVGGEIRQATFLADSDAALGTRPVRFFRFDHLPGGFLFVPKDAAVEAAPWKAITVEGVANRLAR